MENKYCFTCGSYGFPEKKCPSCGREATKHSLNLEQRENTADFVQKIDEFGIPGVYRGVFWDARIMHRSHQDKELDENFQHFINQLEKVNLLFTKGVLPPKSAIIVAPAGYGKVTFAYSCMQRALDNGFSVAPLLDTIEVKRLMTLAAENPNYKLYGNILYDTYVMSDIVFITVTKLRAREWAYEILQEVIDRRARKGLSTFVVSRYTLEEISKRDYTNQFEAVCTAVSQDSYKYPSVIMYKNLFGK